MVYSAQYGLYAYCFSDTEQFVLLYSPDKFELQKKITIPADNQFNTLNEMYLITSTQIMFFDETPAQQKSKLVLLKAQDDNKFAFVKSFEGKDFFKDEEQPILDVSPSNKYAGHYAVTIGEVGVGLLESYIQTG